MIAHRIETTMKEDRTLTLENLPFQAGDAIEIIIQERSASPQEAEEKRYPLRGAILRYEEPFEPVALEDWHALR